MENLFKAIYREYDLRFVYQAPALAGITRRRLWDVASPALSDSRIGSELQPRVGDDLEAERAFQDETEDDEIAD